jgi:5'(3')-deoxyribonucleotidase
VRKRICIDMDEVIADTLGEHIERYNHHFSEHITKADLTGKWLRDAVAADRHANLDAWLSEEDFFEDLPLMEDSQRVLARLQQEYELFIASAAMEVPTSFNAKYKWLGRHFPFIPSSHIVFCGDKSILRADYLIDDNPRQLRRFQGEGILFSSPHNALVTGFRRVDNWLDVERIFFSADSSAA